MLELAIRPKEVTLVSRFQPWGPLYLWQCFEMSKREKEMIIETRSACESPESAKDLLLAAKMWKKMHAIVKVSEHHVETRSSWLNCALRGDEAVYWVSIGQQCLVFGGT